MGKGQRDKYVRFPATRSSIIASRDGVGRKPDLPALARAYWAPIRTYALTRWSMTASAADDAVQEFFVRCLERDTFTKYEKSRGRFRTFLRVCFDRFVVDRHRRDAAAKRGGGQDPIELSGTEPGIATKNQSDDWDRMLEQAWARHVVDESLAALRRELTERKKEQHLRAFEMMHFHGDDQAPSYAQVAAELGISVTDVTNRLSYARRAFRAAVMRTLRGLAVDAHDLQDDVTALVAAYGEDLLSIRK